MRGRPGAHTRNDPADRGEYALTCELYRPPASQPHPDAAHDMSDPRNSQGKDRRPRSRVSKRPEAADLYALISFADATISRAESAIRRHAGPGLRSRSAAGPPPGLIDCSGVAWPCGAAASLGRAFEAVQGQVMVPRRSNRLRSPLVAERSCSDNLTTLWRVGAAREADPNRVAACPKCSLGIRRTRRRRRCHRI